MEMLSQVNMNLPEELDTVFEVELVGGANYWISESTYLVLADALLHYKPENNFGVKVICMSGSEFVTLISSISGIHKSTKEQREFSNKANKLYAQEERERRDWDEE
jgi:hypothetical protein